MGTSSAEFVLDEGLDDDEDMLAFHSQRQRSNDGVYTPTPSPSSHPPATSATSATSAAPAPPAATPATPLAAPPDAVIVDGMPLTASRADLDAFLAAAMPITSLQLRRLETPRALRARVRFASPEAAALALARDGAEFAPGVAVAVKPASEEGWRAGCNAAEGRAGATEGAVAVRGLGLPAMPALPDSASLSNSFWSAFGAARAAAEQLEERAKRLGEELEGRLHVTEKVAETRKAIERADEELKVSERVGEMAAVGKAAAGGLDERYGISEGVGRFVGGVSGVARIVAGEVDENLRVSERAREAANAAMKNETFGPTVRGVVGGLSSESPAKTPRRKNYTPRGVRQEDADETPPEGSTVPEGFQAGTPMPVIGDE